MSAEDARFEDAGAAALRLRAMDAEDLTVLSALLQDAVLTAADMHHDPARRRFALLLNRFRWEDAPDAQRRHRPFERVRSLLVIDDVLKVAAQGIDRRDGDLVLSLLSVGFEPDRDGTGRVLLTFAGDGTLACFVECIDVVLRDVTRPHLAHSVHPPRHPEEG
jgi:hypothetical protein